MQTLQHLNDRLKILQQLECRCTSSWSRHVSQNTDVRFYNRFRQLYDHEVPALLAALIKQLGIVSTSSLPSKPMTIEEFLKLKSGWDSLTESAMIILLGPLGAYTLESVSDAMRKQMQTAMACLMAMEGSLQMIPAQ